MSIPVSGEVLRESERALDAAHAEFEACQDRYEDDAASARGDLPPEAASRVARDEAAVTYERLHDERAAIDPEYAENERAQQVLVRVQDARRRRRGITHELTDLANAERFAHQHRDHLRYAPEAGWHAYDGKRWKRDDDGATMRAAKETARSIRSEAAKMEGPKDAKRAFAWAYISQSAPRLAAMVKLAESEEDVILRADQLDRDRFLLNTAGGTLDSGPRTPRSPRFRTARRDGAVPLAGGVDSHQIAHLPLGRPTRMDRHCATRRLRALQAAAGVKIDRMHPHMLCHTFVTTMLDAGVDLRDVQIAARHADPRTTMRYSTVLATTSTVTRTTSWPSWPRLPSRICRCTDSGRSRGPEVRSQLCGKLYRCFNLLAADRDTLDIEAEWHAESATVVDDFDSCCDGLVQGSLQRVR